ncbi:MAG TPA: hypothetical protein VHO70_00440 [Chitinispirillaceae bacterium]|nr:hypothetical protein [Chitinispirillaceae bacterium]
MRFLTGFFILILAGLVFPQSDSIVSNPVDSLHTDTLHAARVFIDTAGQNKNGKNIDSLKTTKVTTEVASPDKNGPLLIKRTYEFKSQVRLGVAMMIFIAVIFSTAQAWNP